MAEVNAAHVLRTAFDKVLMEKFGNCVPPPPYVTPFGIKHFDAILGGGFTSSAPVALSSTPETGKSTLALQFCTAFQHSSPDSVCVYLNIEEAAAENSKIAGIASRSEVFGIDEDRFLHKPMAATVIEVFELIKQLVEIKMKMEERIKREFRVLFVVDSIADIITSKHDSVEDANSIIG